MAIDEVSVLSGHHQVLPAESAVPTMPSRHRAAEPGQAATYLLVLLVTAANAVWIFLDNSTPSWDQSHYLDVAWRYQHALDQRGISGLVHALYSVDPARAPLYSLLLVPFLYVFGDGPRSAMFFDLALTPVFLAVIGLIAYKLFANRGSQQLTIVAAATMPLLVALSHEILQDFLLLTLVTIAVWLMLSSEFFTKRTTMALLGVTMGLGTLTKASYPFFIVGPLIVVAVARARLEFRSDRPRSSDRRILTLLADIGVATIPALALVVAWYVPNWGSTLSYIRSTTSGALGAGVGSADPFTLHAFAGFAISVLDWNISVFVALIVLTAAVCCVWGALAGTRLRETRAREPGGLSHKVFVASLLFSWFAIPYLLVALSQSSGVRYIAPAMPAVAIAVGGSITAVPWRGMRAALVVLFVSGGAFQTVASSSALATRPPVVLTLQTSAGPFVLPLVGESLDYESPPMPDYGTPIVRTMARVSAGRPGRLCLLESDPIVNLNTFLYLVNEHNLPLTVEELFVGASGQDPSLAPQLRQCTFALYVRQPKLAGTATSARLMLVNGNVAADFMTPALEHLFKGPVRTYYVGYGEYVQLLTATDLPPRRSG